MLNVSITPFGRQNSSDGCHTLAPALVVRLLQKLDAHSLSLQRQLTLSFQGARIYPSE